MKKLLKKRDSLETIGGRLKSWRKSLSLTLVEVSKIVAVSQGTLSDIENGKSLPSGNTLTNLSINTNIDVYWLLTGRKSKQERLVANNESVSQKNDSPFTEDSELKEYIDKLIRIFRHGDPTVMAQLKGFLTGADPKK